jgi:hypothetical protein
MSVWQPYTLGKRPAQREVLGVTEEVQRVADALNAVEAIPDREARVLARSKTLAEVIERNEEKWKAERDALVVELRAQKVPFRKIAARVGVSLGTVQDILRGHSGPWGSRPKPTEPTPPPPDEESST